MTAVRMLLGYCRLHLLVRLSFAAFFLSGIFLSGMAHSTSCCWWVCRSWVCILEYIDVKGHVGTAGVNPMITTESIAYMVGQGMAGKYRHLAGKRRGPVDIKYEEGKQ
jgi:hypothetical protein